MQTLNEKFIRVCLEHADQEAMRMKTSSGWSTFKYKDLLSGARKIAFWLQKEGFQKHQKAAIIFDNCPQWSMVYFGVLLAGGIVVPLDPQASRQDLTTFMEDAEVDFVFLENRLLNPLQHHLRTVKRIVVLKNEKSSSHCLSLDEILAKGRRAEEVPVVLIDIDDTAAILYSSGTTANPKGVELSHKNLYANFEAVHALKVCTAGDHFISILPLFHAYAFMATLLYPLFIGARITYPKTIKSAELVSIIKDTGVTMVVGVPELFHNIHKNILEKIHGLSLTSKLALNVIANISWQLRKWTRLNLSKLIFYSIHDRFGSHLRYLISGGARLDPKIAADLEKFGFTIIEGYGLTETSPLVTFNPPHKPKIGSVGKPVEDVEVKIMNPDNQGIGEIVIRGTNVMKGYYRKPEETAQVLKDGWFYSGDLGYFDRSGYLYISGRSKEVIVLGSGKNIFPDEIEKHYSKSKFIKEMGMFLSQEERSGSLKAVVVPDLDVFKRSGQINIEEKIRWDIENISKELTSYKRIMGFVISKEELPRTRLGKIKRYQLPLIYTRESMKAESEKKDEAQKDDDLLIKTPLGRRIADYLKTELSLSREVASTDHLELDLGVDSLSRVELISAFEKLFRIRLPDDALLEVATVGDLISKIDAIIRSDFSEEYPESSPKASWHDVLHFDIANKDFEAIDLNPKPPNRFLDFLIKGFLVIVFKVFFRLKIINKENLPSQGPYILCCNHASYLDAFIVVCGISKTIASQTYFIGLKDIFEHPAIKWTTQLARVIPIDPTAELVRAMQAASYILRHDKILCIFPEGQRSIDGEVKRFKKGVGILAKELDVNLIPVAIYGSHEAWPRTAVFPKPHSIKIIFGKPVNFKDMQSGASKASEDDYKFIADKIRDEVVHLWQQVKDSS